MRLFVAVWPSVEVVAALAALPRPEVPGLRWTTPEQWHVTLRFLGEADLAEARAAFAAIEAGPPPVVEVGPATGRFGRRILHVPASGLEGAAAATALATAAVGQAPGARPFAGHVTLARAGDRRGVDLRPLVGAPVAGRFAVDRLTLVASRPGRGEARYEIVEALPVGPAAPRRSGPPPGP